VARARGWYTVAGAAGSSTVAGVVGDAVIASDLVDPTILRTRAYAGLAFASTEHPPFSIGNATAPMVLRLFGSTADDPPESGWQFEPSAPDDLTFHPLVWDSGCFVPASLDLSRPDHFFSNAYPAGGVVDVQSQRHFAGEVDVLISYWMGPALTTATAGDPLFTAQWWIRCLIEATI
jgi:hypothetical protein